MKEKILVAIRDTSLARIVSEELTNKGYNLFLANNGEEVLEKMHSQSPDLAIIDLFISGKDGYSILTEKSLDRFITKIPVIVISNSGLPVEMRKIPSTSTVKDFIIKTHIEPDEILEKVYTILGGINKVKSDILVKEKVVGKKILWIEDDKLLSSILIKKFENSGHTLLKASNSDETFAILDKEIPDIIILDILLPGMNGFDILQKIKVDEKLRKIPSIVLSNMSKPSDIEKAKMLGAQKFLVKAAVSLDEIIKEVNLLT